MNIDILNLPAMRGNDTLFLDVLSDLRIVGKAKFNLSKKYPDAKDVIVEKTKYDEVWLSFIHSSSKKRKYRIFYV